MDKVKQFANSQLSGKQNITKDDINKIEKKVSLAAKFVAKAEQKNNKRSSLSPIISSKHVRSPSLIDTFRFNPAHNNTMGRIKINRHITNEGLNESELPNLDSTNYTSSQHMFYKNGQKMSEA